MASRLDKHDQDLIRNLTKRIQSLEEKIDALPGLPKTLGESITKLTLLMEQLNKHVNPTREEVILLKRTNRELSRELLKMHDLLKKEFPL